MTKAREQEAAEPGAKTTRNILGDKGYDSRARYAKLKKLRTRNVKKGFTPTAGEKACWHKDEIKKERQRRKRLEREGVTKIPKYLEDGTKNPNWGKWKEYGRGESKKNLMARKKRTIQSIKKGYSGEKVGPTYISMMPDWMTPSKKPYKWAQREILGSVTGSPAAGGWNPITKKVFQGEELGKWWSMLPGQDWIVPENRGIGQMGGIFQDPFSISSDKQKKKKKKKVNWREQYRRQFDN